MNLVLKKEVSLGKLIEKINNKKDLSEFIQQNAYEEIPSTIVDDENQKKITCYDFVNNLLFKYFYIIFI